MPNIMSIIMVTKFNWLQFKLKHHKRVEKEKTLCQKSIQHQGTLVFFLHKMGSRKIAQNRTNFKKIQYVQITF